MSAEQHSEHAEHHVMPLNVYLGVFGALLVLTVITVGVSYLDLGPLSIFVAMIVALIKAGFVVGYFMHLKFDTKFHQLVFFGSLLFMVIFFVLTFIDLATRSKVQLINDTFALANQKRVAAQAREQESSTKAPMRGVKLGAADATAVAAAETIFSERCATCHGADGAASTPTARALDPHPRAFNLTDWQATATDERIAAIIVGGGPEVGLSQVCPSQPDLKKKANVLAALVQKVRGFKPSPPAAVAPATTQPATTQPSTGSAAATEDKPPAAQPASKPTGVTPNKPTVGQPASGTAPAPATP